MSPRLASAITSRPCSRAARDDLGQRRPAGRSEPLEARDLELDRDAVLGHRLDRRARSAPRPRVRRTRVDRRASHRPARQLDARGPQPGRIRVEPQHQLGLARGDLSSQPVAEPLPARCPGHRFGHVTAAPSIKSERYLTAFFSPAPAENFGTRDAAIWIRSPVAGLRPSRALRCETLNLPKPEKVTSLPRLSAPSIVSRTASTALGGVPLAQPGAICDLVHELGLRHLLPPSLGGRNCRR